MEQTKGEMIKYIIEESRKVSKIKDRKKRERYLDTARLHLMKSTEAQVENLYLKIKEDGAEQVFGSQSG